MSKALYVNATPKELDYIIRLAEARLAAQLTLGVAADQRAMTLASFLAAVEGAVITGLVAVTGNGSAPASLIIMVIGFAFAAVLALIAAQPVDWDIVGTRPSDWVQDIADGTDLDEGHAARASHLDEMIADNDATMKRNGGLVKSAIFAVVVTLLMAGVMAVPVGWHRLG